MPNEQKKYLIDVAPLARLPISKQQYFSYIHSEPLVPGTLVSVPLFRRNIEGIVLNTRPDFEHTGGFQLKKISFVIEKEFLTSSQLQLAHSLSEYYLSSLGVMLKHFIPKRVKARNISNQQSVISNQQSKKSIILTDPQTSAVDQICNPKKLTKLEANFLLYGPSSSGKTEVYLHSILKIKESNPDSQFLILLPELTLAPQAIERYSKYFSKDEIVILHSKLSKGKYYSNWEKIRSGAAKVIISTRIGIFAPFKSLAAVFVDEEQDMSYKQWDMNPRYDARQGSIKLGEIFNAPVIFGTATPRIETYFKSLDGEFTMLKLPKLKIPDTDYELPAIDYKIVDMRKEKWTDFAGKKKANHSLLSLKLQEEISYALGQNLQSILFVNHQGMSTFSICTSCKAVLKCPKCQRALVYDNSGIYKCLSCNYVTDVIPTCKSCGGLEFSNIGIGTQLVEREVKKLFPKAAVRRLDTAAIKKPGAQEEIYHQFNNKKIDILIGTQMITKGWDNPNVGLIGVIDADSLFSMPDYLTDERAYGNIMQVAGRTARVGSRYPGQVIIQTFNPVNPVLKVIIENDYESFYKKETAQREALNYPPFGKIIKLTFQDPDASKVEKETLAIFNKFNDATLPEDFISLLGPDKPMVSNVRGKHRQQILLKFKKREISLSQSILKILGSLSTGWIIDVDPISIA